MNFLVHLFLPHTSNNHRPKILHHQSLLTIIIVLGISQLAFLFLMRASPTVLGIATNITVEKLFNDTNKQREIQRLPPLTLDSELSAAALNKANDMLNRNYWAHNSPDGTTPWVFVKEAGYEYSFAGENLAKDFSNSSDIVKAWIESPKHRDNLLSENFQDIGFAVVSGKLNGADTTLVVQILGKRAKAPAIAQNSPSINQPLLIHGVMNSPLIDSNQVSRGVMIGLLSLIMLTLFVDIIVIKRRKIVRLVGHNFDHILFLSGPLIISLFKSGGTIL